MFARLSPRARLTLRGAGAPVRNATPVLCLESERQAEALHWSLASQDVLATASSADADLHLFDLGICDEDAPTTTLVGDPQARPRCFHTRVALVLSERPTVHRTRASWARHAAVLVRLRAVCRVFAVIQQC